jgi:hypothetical protein
VDSSVDQGGAEFNLLILEVIDNATGERLKDFEDDADAPADESTPTVGKKKTLTESLAERGYSLYKTDTSLTLGEVLMSSGDRTYISVARSRGRILIKNHRDQTTNIFNSVDQFMDFLDKHVATLISGSAFFENATDEFKAWVMTTKGQKNGSPFATAQALEEAAIRNGASIQWGAFNGATFDSIFVDDDGDEWTEEDFYSDDDDDEDDLDHYESDIFDSSDHWKKQPRNRKSGRWELRRGKRIKDAAKGALHALGRAASRANSYVSQALNGGGNKHSHSSSEALAAVGHAGAELDPGAAAIGELLGSIRSVTRVLDSVTLDANEWSANDANYNPNTDGYIGKVIKDGELVGRINLADNGGAMVYVGAEGNQQSSKDGSKGSYLSGKAATQLIDWLFAGLNGEQGSGDDAPIANDKPSKALTNIQSLIALVDAAYTFNATEPFKAWLGSYVAYADYPNPFLTAKAMDEDAIRNGASIQWGGVCRCCTESIN